MFRFNILALAVVAFAAYASADFVNFCNCTKDVESYKTKYEALYKEYYDKTKLELEKAHNATQERIEKTIAKDNPCNLSTKPDDYIQDTMALCGYNRLSKDYVPIWKDKEVSNEETCRLIAVRMPALKAQTKSTESLIANCDYMSLFDESIKTVLEGCKKCKDQ